MHDDVPGKVSAAHDYRYMTDLITEKAESVIAKHDREKPLYLQLAHIAVHSSDAEAVMEVRDENETNDTFGYIQDFNRRKFAGL